MKRLGDRIITYLWSLGRKIVAMSGAYVGFSQKMSMDERALLVAHKLSQWEKDYKKRALITLDKDLEDMVWRFVSLYMEIVKEYLLCKKKIAAEEFEKASLYVEKEIGLHGDDAKNIVLNMMDAQKIYKDFEVPDQFYEELNHATEGLSEEVSQEVRRRIGDTWRTMFKMAQEA